MEQRSSEWFLARCGFISASRAKDLMAKDDTAAYQNYRAQLVAERMTGEPQESFCSAAMQHGIDTEPQARELYQLVTGNDVEECGFCVHDNIKMFGASPDGIVSDCGLVEIKCPNTATHINYKTSRKVPNHYYDQMQIQMECTGREWCDFFSYDPRLPFPANYFLQRVERDAKRIAEIIAAVEKMNLEVENIIQELQK